MKEKHLIVRSRNTSCSPLREIVVPRPTILRLGSTTPTSKITKCPNPIEINTVRGCALSNSKDLMKQIFVLNQIPTAEYIYTDNISKVLSFFETYGIIICKHIHSSKGKGIYLLKSREDIINWSNDHNLKYYIFEKYYSYSREYRMHITKNGCFLANRKMLKNNAKDRWHRHSSNSVWISEENPLFDKPSNWDKIVEACIKALKALELDIAAFDVKVQNSKHQDPKFIILESNSAPSLGEQSIKKYTQELSRLIYEFKF